MTAPAAPIPNDPPRRTKGEGPIGRMVNLGGVFGAATLMVIAIARVAAERVDDPPLRFEPAIVREELAKGNPAAYAAMACVMLAITPPLRVLVLAIYLAIQKRYGFALLGFAVVAILATGFWLV